MEEQEQQPELDLQDTLKQFSAGLYGCGCLLMIIGILFPLIAFLIAGVFGSGALF